MTRHGIDSFQIINCISGGNFEKDLKVESNVDMLGCLLMIGNEQEMEKSHLNGGAATAARPELGNRIRQHKNGNFAHLNHWPSFCNSLPPTYGLKMHVTKADLP
jgi:hypothetical protein